MILPRVLFLCWLPDSGSIKMNSETKYLFYLGKGGVGKSTISAITAALLSDNSKVVLISLDPAHNQTDIFLRQPADGIIKIKNNLELIEINTEKWISKYLADVETQIRNNYLYLTAFNLEDNFKILKYSPRNRRVCSSNGFCPSN